MIVKLDTFVNYCWYTLLKMKTALSVVRPPLATQLKFKTKIRRGLRSLSAAVVLLGRLLSAQCLS